jgi:hypothetical protein
MKKLISSILSLLVLAMVLNACYYDEVVVFQGLPTNVSFKNDVMPILSQNCSNTGCHDAVPAHAPSLVQDKAYNALINGGFINTNEPDKSNLYTTMLTGGMPPSGPLGTNDLKIILGWITDGAKNN